MNKEILEDLKTGVAVLAFLVLVGLAFIFLAWVGQKVLA
jgi:hypothetical protein